ncbi:MAG TPA: sigma 54-interacting transcriptional regulator [Candidatus Binatia bacterium]|jgi:DNA-binding NtrC family response regulator
MQAKRILVIEESEVVRETLALILGREFVVAKRPFGKGIFSFGETDRDVDLLILGVTPAIGREPSTLLRFADKAPFAVLFLVDSKSAARAIDDRETVGCLAKPFSPYELKEKVGQLLARRNILSDALSHPSIEPQGEFGRYLQFPYLSRAAASLARRFAATGLPILISGEGGCGQERVARGIHFLGNRFGSWVSLHAAEINNAYLDQKSLQLSWCRRSDGAPVTLIIESIDRVSLSGQTELLNFLEEEETKFGKCRLITTARVDILEKVYRDELLDSLYYKLATLKLSLRPLRERREDVPAIASWFCQLYADHLGLGEVSLSADANERLRNYLWFGNLNEMEAVIARTLAVQRKSWIEAADLIFDSSVAGESSEIALLTELSRFEPPGDGGRESGQSVSEPHNGLHAPATPDMSQTPRENLNVLIHELAHELKNPMVTIKTFAQLLTDRYQDENFRARFQDVVGGDIERMDDLLELMIEFADFTQPRWSKVPLQEKLRSALNEVTNECARRQAQIKWKGNGYSREISGDETQVKYVLKNVLLAVLSQAKMGSEIEINVEKQGCVAISYLREVARVASITHYFDKSSSSPSESVLPLRLLLAKQLIERNGGNIVFDYSDTEKDILKMEFRIA